MCILLKMIDEYKEIETRLLAIEAVLTDALPKQISKDWMSRVFSGIANGENISLSSPSALLSPGRELLQRGGKRWRPLLMLLVCEALGGKDRALCLSPLVELCHNASLLHDDIEDDSAQRRGKPAIHLLYGTDTAINSACFLYFLPLISIDSLKTSESFKYTLYRSWSLAMRRLHLGQSMDIDWHKKVDYIPSLDDYFSMCALKTGVLARFAAELGVLSLSLNDEKTSKPENGDAVNLPVLAKLADTLGTAAEKLGQGFQILDDVHNLTVGIPGKKRGDDVVEGKMSLPVLLFLRKEAEKTPASLHKLAFVQDCFINAKKNGTSAPEVGLFIDALREDGALEAAEGIGRRLIKTAQAAFSDLPPPVFDEQNAERTAPARALLADFTRIMLAE